MFPILINWNKHFWRIKNSPWTWLIFPRELFFSICMQSDISDSFEDSWSVNVPNLIQTHHPDQKRSACAFITIILKSIFAKSWILNDQGKVIVICSTFFINLIILPILYGPYSSPFRTITLDAAIGNGPFVKLSHRFRHKDFEKRF